MVHPQEDLIDFLSDDSDGLDDVDLSQSKKIQQKTDVVGQKPHKQQAHLDSTSRQRTALRTSRVEKNRDNTSIKPYDRQKTPIHTMNSKRAAQQDSSSRMHPESSAPALDRHGSNAHSNTKATKSPPTGVRESSGQRKAKVKMANILEALLGCARASGHWLKDRTRSAKAVLSSTLFRPLRFAFNWLATILVITIVLLITGIILFKLLKLVACQFPGVEWFLWISGNSCDSSISSLLPLELLSSIAQGGCQFPGMSMILYKYGVNCNVSCVSNSELNRKGTGYSTPANPVHMIVNSSHGITLLQEPAMDLYKLAQGLGASRRAIFDAGVKIYLTSLPDSTKVAQDHYLFSKTIDQHKEELEDFYSRLTIFIRFIPVYLASVEKRIQTAQLQEELPWYYFSNLRHFDLSLGRDLDRYFNFMKEEIDNLIQKGEIALNHLKEDDGVWERLEQWRVSHVKDIQNELFKPKTLQEWWAPHKRQHQKHNLDILVEVHRSHYSPMRLRLDEILILLRTTLINMKNAQLYIQADILAGREFERASVTELIEWSTTVHGLSAAMSEFKESHRRARRPQ